MVTGIHHHPFRKLGKRDAVHDPRTLKLAKFLRAMPVPDEYDFDLAHPKTPIPLPMFANDQYGCCVISEVGHQTLRFELLETGKLPTITDQDIIREYMRQTGGQDSGLELLSSLKQWQKHGLQIGSKTFKIKTYAQINQLSQQEVKQTIFSDVGSKIGLMLPQSADDQLSAGKVWDVVKGSKGDPGSWGGHCVYLCGYHKDKSGVMPVCVTWGQKQVMTWNFFKKYCDEAYAVFDASDSSKLRSSVNLEELHASVKRAA
jgi:hypothetical protein